MYIIWQYEGGTYWNQFACCNGNIIFYVQPGVSVRNDYRTACFCGGDVCGCQSAVWRSSYCHCQCAHICIIRASIYGICKENKCYVVCTHVTVSQSDRLSSDHEESRR